MGSNRTRVRGLASAFAPCALAIAFAGSPLPTADAAQAWPGFDPSVEGTLGEPGATARGAHPPLDVLLRLGERDATLATATMTLPRAVELNAAAFARACPSAAHAAGACPERSLVGSASVRSTRSSVPLDGPLRLIGDPGSTPRLALQLGGTSLTATLADGPQGVTATFDEARQLPLTDLTLAIDGGAGGLLTATEDLCEPRLLAPISGLLATHGGAIATVDGYLDTPVCEQAADTPAAAVQPRVQGLLRVRGDRGRLIVRVRAGADGADLRRVAVALPPGLRAPLARTLDLRLPLAVDAMRMDWPKLRLTRRLRRALHASPRPRVRIGVVVTDAEGWRHRVPIRVRAAGRARATRTSLATPLY